jgi:hypothetical protein
LNVKDETGDTPKNSKVNGRKINMMFGDTDIAVITDCKDECNTNKKINNMIPNILKSNELIYFTEINGLPRLKQADKATHRWL